VQALSLWWATVAYGGSIFHARGRTASRITWVTPAEFGVCPTSSGGFQPRFAARYSVALMTSVADRNVVARDVASWAMDTFGEEAQADNTNQQ
jgi:hypothetical protein